MTETLTNEGLKDICQSTFELARYAIELARYYIKSGRETHLSDIVRDIKRHPNPKYIEELHHIDEIEKKAQEQYASHE